MIIQTTKEINGVIYDYTYSDAGYTIERDGVMYIEAVDPLDSGRLYEETAIPLEDEEATIDDYQQALSELGVSV